MHYVSFGIMTSTQAFTPCTKATNCFKFASEVHYGGTGRTLWHICFSVIDLYTSYLNYWLIYISIIDLWSWARVVCWRPHLAGTRQYIQVSYWDIYFSRRRYHRSSWFGNSSMYCIDFGVDGLMFLVKKIVIQQKSPITLAFVMWGPFLYIMQNGSKRGNFFLYMYWAFIICVHAWK